MKRIITLAVVIMAVLTAIAQDIAINTLSAKEKKEGWQLLFNGKNLDGWTTFDGKKVTGWKVMNGILNTSGGSSVEGGDIITTKKFKSFELSLEWKIAPQSNSGIFYHVDVKGGKTIPETAPEYQLIDDKGWPEKLHADQYSGANYAMNAPQNAVVKNIDEWNQSTIIVDGSHVGHFLNGVKVVDYHLWDADWQKRKEAAKWKDFPNYGMAKKGNIGLQDHGGLTEFRNMKIRKIHSIGGCR